MTPETIFLLVSYAVKFGIPAALEISALFEKKDATVADVRAAFAKSHKAYEDYEGSLPPGVPSLPPH